jgi:hypothetical protein
MRGIFVNKAYAAGTKLIVKTDRAWLYESPHSKEKTTMYIVKGDVVAVVNAVGTSWLQVDYLRSNGHLLRKWIRIDDISPL